MARKNFFQIASSYINMETDSKRVYKLLMETKTLEADPYYYTIAKYVDVYCFKSWKYRSHYINVEELFDSIRFNSIVKKAQKNVDDFLMLIELSYNFWNLAHKDLIIGENDLRYYEDFYHLQTIMDDCLQQLNYKIYEEDERVLVIEDKPEVTAVVEIVDEPVALDFIRYNHFSLKGDLAAKKSILVALGRALEPQEKALNSIDSKLKDAVFYLLNNMDIRHNNSAEENKKAYYKGYVANMSAVETEEWYDELYQLILLANLELNNKGRMQRFSQLKDKIENWGKCKT